MERPHSEPDRLLEEQQKIRDVVSAPVSQYELDYVRIIQLCAEKIIRPI